MLSRFAASPADTAALHGLDLNGIMWCDRTLNPGLAGCAYASPACGTADRSSACYAEVTAAGIVRKGRSENAAPGLRDVAEFYAKGLSTEGHWTGRVHVDASRIDAAFDKLPKKPGSRVRRVFVTSMSDLFHDDVPFDFLDRVFHKMWARPHLTFQVLTKRPDRMAAYARERLLEWPRNVWPGTTVEDQRRANERIHHLLRVRAAVRFLSVEPMLGPIDLRAVPGDPPGSGFALLDGFGLFDGEGPPGIHQVIIGSESDGPRPGKRETREEWVAALIDDCDAAGVPVFLKQLTIGGRLVSLPTFDGRVRAEFPEVPRA